MRLCIRLEVEHIVVYRLVDLFSIYSCIEVVITPIKFQLSDLRQHGVDLLRVAGGKRNDAKHPEVELALAPQSLIDVHLIVGTAGTTDRSEACPVEIFDHRKRARLKRLLGGRRNFGGDDTGTLLFNDAGGFSRGIASNPCIGHFVQRQRLDGPAIEIDSIVGFLQRHWIVRRNLIQFFA